MSTAVEFLNNLIDATARVQVAKYTGREQVSATAQPAPATTASDMPAVESRKTNWLLIGGLVVGGLVALKLSGVVK